MDIVIPIHPSDLTNSIPEYEIWCRSQVVNFQHLKTLLFCNKPKLWKLPKAKYDTHVSYETEITSVS